MSKQKRWPKPKSGGEPKKIEGRGEPGGPGTPGAKKKRAEEAAKKK